MDFRDERHWTQSIMSTGERELYEGRKAIMRYTRERDGDRIVSRKEVRFLDTNDEFETRSLIVQQRDRP